MESILCFTLGLSDEDIKKGEASYIAMNPEAPKLDVIVVTEAMTGMTVGEILEGAMAGAKLNSAGLGPGDGPALCHQYRVVMVNTMDREQVLQVMRSFRAVLPDPRDLIFAVITDTARTWRFAEYIGHLTAEHEFMKARNAEKK
ncbi:MAG: DUF3783 domain-containing protein [Deltaproteobacteria bacterium]